jgi:hypothetical protein
LIALFGENCERMKHAEKERNKEGMKEWAEKVRKEKRKVG